MKEIDFGKIETLMHWADCALVDVECREDEDCDHCFGLQALSDARLALIERLVEEDPMPDTERGKMLLRLSNAQEEYERWAYPLPAPSGGEKEKV